MNMKNYIGKNKNKKGWDGATDHVLKFNNYVDDEGEEKWIEYSIIIFKILLIKNKKGKRIFLSISY